MAALSAGARGASLIEINPASLTPPRLPPQGNARERSPSRGNAPFQNRAARAANHLDQGPILVGGRKKEFRQMLRNYKHPLRKSEGIQQVDDFSKKISRSSLLIAREIGTVAPGYSPAVEKMLKKFLAVAVLVIACVSLGVWVGRTQASASGAAGRTSDSPTNSPAPRILPVAVSVGEGLPARKAAAGDVDGRAAKFAGFNALSEADADWLERHGYPTDEESIRYLNMPDNVVAALAERGDRIAAVFEARRELETKGGTEPVDKLLKLASGGSIFALDQLGSVYQAHGGDKLFLAEAYYEVARRLGGRVPVVAVNFKRSLPPYELGLAMEYSQVVLDRMNALRKAQGLSPITYESRPDAELAFAQHFDEYQQLQQAQGKAAAAPASQQ